MDFSKIEDDLAKEIIRSGESYIDGQVKIATSADQRAAVMASVFAAAGAALAAGVITIASSSAGKVAAPLILGGATAAVLFLAGASACVKATMPATFWLPGADPKCWESDVTSGRDLKDALGEMADHIQAGVDANMAVLERNAQWFKWGGRLGIAAPFVGFAVWALVLVGRLTG